MIYLKPKMFGQIKEYREGNSTVEDLLNTGNWIRVQGRNNPTPYSAPKKATKKSTKKK